jgi:hypothetical protein
MNSKLPLGKIDPKILGKLLSQYTSAGKRVLIGAGVGEDAAVIDLAMFTWWPKPIPSLT